LGNFPRYWANGAAPKQIAQALKELCGSYTNRAASKRIAQPLSKSHRLWGGDVAKKEPRKKMKNDPRLVAAARELRDRWLEEVNAGAAMLVGNGKYDVSRELAGAAGDVGVERVERKQITAIAA
jgi:hypothetical protein